MHKGWLITFEYWYCDLCGNRNSHKEFEGADTVWEAFKLFWKIKKEYPCITIYYHKNKI